MDFCNHEEFHGGCNDSNMMRHYARYHIHPWCESTNSCTEFEALGLEIYLNSLGSMVESTLR